MFVKNVLNVLSESQAIIIRHEGTSIYTGTAVNTPFYLENEKVLGIDISSNSIRMTI